MSKQKILTLISIIPISLLIAPRTVSAGKGKMTQAAQPDPIHVSTYVHVAFPPTPAQLDDIKDKLTRATRTICDATDGQVLVDEIYLERNGLSADIADVIWLPDGQISRFSASTGGKWYGHDVARFRVANQVEFWAVAHEFAHLLFGLRDQYNRQRKNGTGCGIGESIEESDLSSTVHTIMQAYKPVCMHPTNGLTTTLCSDDSTCIGELNDPGARCYEFSPLASEFNNDQYFEPAHGLGFDMIPWPGISPGEKLWISGRMYAGISSATWEPTSSFEFLDSVGDLEAGSSHRIRFKARSTGTAHEFEIQAFIGPSIDELDLLSWTVGGVSTNTLTVEFDPAATNCGVVLAGTDSFSLAKINGLAPPWTVTLDITAKQLKADYETPADFTGGDVSLDVDFTNLCEKSGIENAFPLDLYEIREADGIGTGTYIGREAAQGQTAISTDAVYQQLASCSATDRDDMWRGDRQRWVNSDQYRFEAGRSDWELIKYNLKTRWPERSTDLNGNFPDDLFISQPSPIVAAPDGNANGVDCTTFAPVIDDDRIEAVNTIALLIDRSGSMADDWSNLGTTQPKIDWARAGAVGFAKAGEGQGLSLSVATFNATVEPGDKEGPLEPAPALTGISADDVADMTDVPPDGKTAIGDAVKYAVENMLTDDTAANAIFLLTDGERTAGIPIEEASDLAVAANIPVFISPVGSFDASDLETMASKTDGLIFSTLNADEIPASFFAMRGKMRSEDLSLVYEESSLSNWDAQLPGSIDYDILVETGANRLVMLLTPAAEIKSSWAVDFTLSGPLGETITKASSSHVFEHEDRFFYLITVPNPSPGTWTMTLEAPDPLETPKINPETQLLMAHIEHEGPRCRVSTSTTLVDDVAKEVQVYAEAEWSGLVGTGVEFSGSVRRPDGTVSNFTMTPQPDGVAKGVFSNYSFDGVYQVKVSCHASADATYSVGEDVLENPVLIPGEFKRTGMSYFVLDDDLPLPLPGGYQCSAQDADYDHDGIPDRCDLDTDADDVPNSAEYWGDTDGDGVADVRDHDSDDDGDFDGEDWDPTDPTSHRRYAEGDFNGDGLVDYAWGEPDYNSNGGRILVKYVGEADPVQWYQNSTGINGITVADDKFGVAIASGDFNGDGYDDIAVGSPGENHSGVGQAGAVNVIYGSVTGLVSAGDQYWAEYSSGILGSPEQDDRFGARLITGDFNCDGHDDLVIGTPDEAVGANAEAGAAHVLYGSAGGLSSVNDLWYQGNSGVNGSSEAGDRFGDSLGAADFNADGCDDLVIGAPNEDSSGYVDAGNAYAMYGSATGLTTTGDWTIIQGVLQHPLGTDDLFSTRMWTPRLGSDIYYDLVIMTPNDCGPGLDGAKGFNYIFGSASGLTITDNVWFCREYR